MVITAKKEDVYTAKYILERVAQEDIMQKYLGIPVQFSEQVCNPLRRDKHPTCTFKWIKGRLRFTDWADNENSGREHISNDCFDVVKIRFGCDYNTALHKIAHDFKLVLGDLDLRELTPVELDDSFFSYTGARIQVKIRNFSYTDASYLNQYGLDRESCNKYNVYSLSHVWINGSLYYMQINNMEEDDPCLGYFFGEKDNQQLWKIYWYKRNQDKFRCNAPNAISGWNQLPSKGLAVVITKSHKDVMVLDKLNIPAIAPQSESYYFDPTTIFQLKSRFSRIFCLYDYDRTGVAAARRLKDNYNIEPVFLTNGIGGTFDFGAKDISDYVKLNGVSATKELINNCITRFRLYDQNYGVRESTYSTDSIS